MARKAMTAAELMAELQGDPEHQQRMRKIELARQKVTEELRDDQVSLVADCKAVGVPISSVWDLVNTSESYEAAIPVLARHLSYEHRPRTIEGIVRALTTPESRGVAFSSLVALFRRTVDSQSELKWLLGAAIAEAATASDASTIVELANDTRHGRGREFLPLGLVQAGSPYALPILERWRSVPELTEASQKAIKLLQ